MTDLIESLILGVVQGLTEFLPVSSSGHLVIAQTMLQAVTPGILLEVWLHIATLLAVILVFHRKLAELAVGAVRRDGEALRYIGLLAVGSLPAAFVGLFLRDQIVFVFDTPAITGVMLLVTGTLLWSTRSIATGTGALSLTWRLALAIGFAQAFAILPGISRSGATIVAGLWGGLRGEKAVEFSFLLAIPAIAGAGFLELLEVGESSVMYSGAELTAGFIAALISGVAAILLLKWLVRRQVFHAFAYYVWPAGLTFLLYLWLLA